MFQPINSDLKLKDAKNVVYLGQATVSANATAQFNIAAKIDSYENLTNADFLVEIVSGTQQSCSVYVTTDDRVNGIGANIMPFTLNKSYNKNTGVLNVASV